MCLEVDTGGAGSFEELAAGVSSDEDDEPLAEGMAEKRDADQLERSPLVSCSDRRGGSAVSRRVLDVDAT